MLNEEIKKGISVFTVCKNRNDHLIEILKSIIHFDQIDEIVVVDWSSDEPLRPIIEQFKSSKIVLAEVPGQKHFLRCHSLNLAARLTTRDTLLRLDADVQVTSDFFSTYSIPENSFYAGKNEQARNQNEYGLTGLIYVKRKDFFEVNGYNEYLTTWGWEDTDLYQRLADTGLNWIGIDYDFFSHIPHEGRFSNLPRLFDDLELNDQEMAVVLGQQSEFLLRHYKWHLGKKMTDYNMTKIKKNLYRAIPEDLNVNLISENVLNESKIYALKKLMYYKTNINKDILKSYTKTDIINIYKYYFQNVNEEFNLYYAKYIFRKNNLYDEYDKAISGIKSSYTWKTGSLIIRFIDFVFGWVPFVRNKIKNN